MVYQLSFVKKGNPLHFLRPLVTAGDTFLNEAPLVTKKGPHIRDAIDIKRWMIMVVVALIPCILMAFWNTGLQKFVYSSGDFNLMNEIQELAPFGFGNQEPVFMVKSVNISNQKLFKEKHLGATVKNEGTAINAMWFNKRDKSTLPPVVDIVFTPEINSWNRKRELRLNIKDVSWNE